MNEGITNFLSKILDKMRNKAPKEPLIPHQDEFEPIQPANREEQSAVARWMLEYEYSQELLKRVYKEYELLRQRLFTDVARFIPNPNQFIAFKTVIVDANNKLIIIAGRFRSGEKYTAKRFEEILISASADKLGSYKGFTSMIRNGVLETNWYIEQFSKRIMPK